MYWPWHTGILSMRSYHVEKYLLECQQWLQEWRVETGFKHSTFSDYIYSYYNNKPKYKHAVESGQVKTKSLND